jgi:REP element-mobilizing transposase RayT
MPRRARLAVAGITWHIIQRGNNRCRVLGSGLVICHFHNSATCESKKQDLTPHPSRVENRWLQVLSISQ